MKNQYLQINRISIALILLLITPVVSALAQDDLLKELEKSEPEKKEYTFSTFKGTRAVNGHSVETKGKNELEFIITHRFGTLNSGAYEFWGLDQASIRLGLEYGITDRLGFGIGRSSYKKIVDSYFKYKLLRQSTGPGSIPITVTALLNTSVQTYPQKKDTTLNFSDRMAYTFQLLIARKITSKLSLQISPTIVHSNLVNPNLINKDQLALGFSGRYKLTRSLAISGEYYHRFDPVKDAPFYNTIGFGFDLETGGHVFQLVMSNTATMTERAFINETDGDFFGGDIHFGFNITRTFQLKKPK